MIGSGGHAKVCIDTCLNLGLFVLGMTSLNESSDQVLGFSVLGDNDFIYKYKPSEIELVNGIGFLPGRPARRQVFNKFRREGYTFSTIIHSSVIISKDVHVGEGAQIMAGAIIQSGSRIGRNCIINTAASVDHDCCIGDHCHLAPRVTICGDVKIKRNTFVGVGSVISNGISIGKNVTVAAGKIVIKSITDNKKLIKEDQTK